MCKNWVDEDIKCEDCKLCNGKSNKPSIANVVHVALRESEARIRNKDAAADILKDATLHAKAIAGEISIEEYSDHLQSMIQADKLTYTQTISRLQALLLS